MVLGFALLGARIAAYASRGVTVASRTAVQTLPKATGAISRTPWGTVAKVGAVGGTVGVAGFGIGSAVSSVDQSIADLTGGRGGGGFLVIGGLVLAVIFGFILMRRR